jgi:WD40 repeat protein
MGNGPSRSRRQGVLLETLAEHDAEINCLAVSEDGSLVVSGSEDGTARMWSTRSDVTECIGVLQ